MEAKTVTQPLGLCPACERSGPIGKACPQPVCARRGYHFIPAAFVTSTADGLVDPMLGQQFSEYLVVRKLGTGGAGGVYLALQRPIWMKAALKVLETDDDGPNEAMLQRFRSEAAALARLNHPNIVRLLKFGSERDRPYLVMEYVEENRTLRSVMRQGLRICEIERVLHQLINALEAAHSSGVIHRDIKPANIMLQSVPGEPHYVRLVDFGLAKFVDEGDTTRFLAGTPAYMAPEQIAKEGIGPGSDWYALGAIAFEMITGLRAYSAAVPEQIIALKQDPHFDPCDALAHLRLPTPTLAFLRGLLAHDPSARLSVAAQIRSALTAAFAPLDPEHIPLPYSEEETPTQGISGLPLRAHRLPQRRISARRKVGLIAAATIGAIALGLLLEALTSSPAPRVEAPPAEAPRAEAPLVAAPPPPP
ncbi:serine/threonine protein kinase, partial [Myxococcota bacterium]|nr:serine/threonine protein kinase [Myxococcota bacterium]